MKHKIKHRDGGLVEVGNYGRAKAIKLFCTECMGWDNHPKDCTATTCPLFPFKGRKMDSVISKSGRLSAKKCHLAGLKGEIRQ